MSIEAALPDPNARFRKNASFLRPHDIVIGSTVILRTGEEALHEELFMERSRTRRLVRVLRMQLDKAQRRRFKTTRVPTDMLDQLLTRVENADT